MATQQNTPIPQNPIGENFAWRDWFQKLSNKVYGSMANQDSGSVNITGGYINGTVIGNTTPATGKFTTLDATTTRTNSLLVDSGTDGQILVGRTSDHAFLPATLGAGGGIAITSGAGSLSIANSGVTSIVAGAGISVSGSTGAVTISQSSTTTKAYGAFHDTTTQTAAAINTAYAVTFDSTDLSSSVSRGSPTSRIVVSNAGIYNIQFSAQLHKTSASVGYIYIWARVSGTNVPDSASKIAINGSQAETIAAWNFVLSMAANDYFELMWSTDNTACELLHNTSVSPVPAIPSVILTVTQV